MNRIDKKFKELKTKKKKAFIAYICAGDPDLKTTQRLVSALDSAGVDIIELGVPFSDPLADGPTIQRASQRALKNKVSLRKILAAVKSLRKFTQIPLILMTYYNPVYAYGVKNFARDAKNAGADGVIVPDLSCEDAQELISASRRHKFDTIFLAAPTSTAKRVKLIAKVSTGFIYYVSLTGVTGARKSLPEYIKKDVKKIKAVSGKPVCVGFGVSTPQQVKRLSQLCDGVIVGSAIINIIEGSLRRTITVRGLRRKNKIPQEAAKFVKNLMRGMR